jgi:GH24 family phage-related lysozyme (muramidase)
MDIAMEKEKKTTRKSAANQAAEVIKKFEGFEPAPYLCPANVPTIG